MRWEQRRHRISVEAGSIDALNLAGGGHRVVSKRLVETDDVPTLLTARAIPGLIPALLDGPTVPSPIAWFDGEPDVGPCDVEMNLLAGREDDRVLSHWFGKPDLDQALDQQLLQPTLCRAVLGERAVEPSLHRCHSVLASTAMSLQVVGGLLRGDQLETPCIFRSASEPERLQRRGQSEQHAQRSGDDQAVISSCEVRSVVPGRSSQFGPRRTGAAGRLGHRRPNG